MMTYSNFNISDRIGMCNDRVGTCQRAYCECAQQFIEVNNHFRFWSSINSSHSFVFHKKGYFNIGQTENSDKIRRTRPKISGLWAFSDPSNR